MPGVLVRGAGGLRVSGSLGTSDGGPVAVRRVVRRDARDQVVDENRARTRRAVPEAVAAQTRGMLESVVRVGTGRAADLGAEGVTAWGKTGTTENYGDAWFVGATDDLTVAVWVGYPDRLRPMETEWRGEAVAGGTYPASIWRSFMVSVLERQRRALEDECRDEEARATDRCREAGLGSPADGPEVPDATAPPVPATPEAPAQPPTAEPAAPAAQAPEAGGDAAPEAAPPAEAPAPQPAPAPEAAPAPAPPAGGVGAG